jgi:hypothetical protein
MATNENILKAISKLYKEKHSTGFIGVVEEGKVIDQTDSGKELPSQEEIDAEAEVQQTAADATAYVLIRKWKYPEIGDQLDALYHAGVFPADMAAEIKKVKDDNPKSS